VRRFKIVDPLKSIFRAADRYSGGWNMQAGQSAGDEAARSLRAAEDHRRKAAWHEERAASFARGRQGEMATAHVLDALAADGYLRIDDCRWPGRPIANVDHVVIGPAGLFVIDAKNWSGKVDVRDGVLRQNGWRRAKEVEAAGEARNAVSALVPFAIPRTEAVICLAGAAQLNVTRLRGATVASASDVVGWIRSQPRVMDPETVQQTYAALSRGLQPARPGQPSQAPSPVPDYIPSQWPSGPVVREPTVLPTRMAGRVPAGSIAAPNRKFRCSRRAAMIGRVLLILLCLDSIGSAVLQHSQQVGALIVALGCAAWLVRLEYRRRSQR
jgi:hypothetical protein